MENKEVALFENRSIRRVWHDEEWWFVVEDVVLVLIDSKDPKQYIKRMKERDPELHKGWVQTVPTLYVQTEGGLQKMNCSNIEGIFRIIQSIPSPKAEPFKLWLAKIGKERLDEIKNPMLAMERMKAIYEQKGYPKSWIEKRMRSIAIRQTLTDEWDKRGADDQKSYAILTNEIMRRTFEMTVPQYKDFKGVQRENLRDHMNDIELILTMLAEATTTELHKTRDSTGFKKLHTDAHEGGEIAGITRKNIEKKTGKPVPSSENFLGLKKQKDTLK